MTAASRRFGAFLFLSLLASALVLTVGESVPPAGAQPSPTAPVPLHAETEPLRVDGPRATAALVAAAALDEHSSSGAVQRQTGLVPFTAIGFSWVGAPGEASTRVLGTDGSWTTFEPLEATPDHDEDGTGAPARLYTEPLATGGLATGYEVVLPTGIRDVQVHFVREGAGTTNAQRLQAAELEPAAAADGIPGPAGIRSRSSWGARVRNQTSPCGSGALPEGRGCVSDTGVNNAVVHHTVHANDYAPSAVPEILRSIQTFHMDVRGWDDIAYNFIVDRFGTIWEGRGGGPDRPVIGAHTAGFNTGSVGVAVLGTFDTAAPTAATLEGVAQVIAWKFAQRNIDPTGTTVLTSRGGDLHPAGDQVLTPNIAGHRDLGQTSCPGQLLYARLPEIRQRVAELMPQFTGEIPTAERFNGQLHLAGFALRRDSASPVTVRLDIDGSTAATTIASVPRSDMAARWGALGANHGFEFTLPVTLSMQRACIYEQSSGTLIGCRDVNPVTPPFGDFSSAVGSTGPPRIDIGGWAIEPDDPTPSPLHVYIDGAFATTVWTGVARPDVAAAYPHYGGNRGFAATIPTTLGTHTVCVYAINVPAGDHTPLGCRAAAAGRTDLFSPRGSLDVVRMEGRDVSVQGWTFDADTTDPIPVHVYVDGAIAVGITADISRPDVAQAFPGSGPSHGYAANLRLAPGTHNVCTYGINDNLVGPNALLGCRTVDVPIPSIAPPSGSLDVATNFLQLVVVAGWAADPDSSDPIPVHVYVDGALHPLTADQSRPDVAQVFPTFGPNRGFVGAIGAAPGSHDVCVYAINDNLIGPHRLLGCRTVVVPQPNSAPPFGSLDVVSRQGATVRVAGWAMDPDGDGPLQVHIYVGGVGTPFTAAGVRDDLPIAFPGRAAEHGFDETLPVPAGANRVCAYAINDNPNAPHTTLGCRSI